jgi:two-component system OmpR family response regulator
MVKRKYMVETVMAPQMTQSHVRAGEEVELRILIVDDEASIVNFLRMGLSFAGFEVATAEDAQTALQQVDSFQPHLVVLDLMLPGVDGMDLAEQLLRNPDLAIIMLTARDQVMDRVLGLNIGADDYVVKPFDFEELVARIRAVARRRLPALSEILRAGPITLDQARREVTINEAQVELTLKEYELLRLFLLHPRRVLPRQLILDRVWGYDFYGTENNVEVYVGYLRRKLSDDDHQLIETVRGVGYRLNV